MSTFRRLLVKAALGASAGESVAIACGCGISEAFLRGASEARIPPGSPNETWEQTIFRVVGPAIAGGLMSVITDLVSGQLRRQSPPAEGRR